MFKIHNYFLHDFAAANARALKGQQYIAQGKRSDTLRHSLGAGWKPNERIAQGKRSDTLGLSA